MHICQQNLIFEKAYLNWMHKLSPYQSAPTNWEMRSNRWEYQVRFCGFRSSLQPWTARCWAVEHTGNTNGDGYFYPCECMEGRINTESVSCVYRRHVYGGVWLLHSKVTPGKTMAQWECFPNVRQSSIGCQQPSVRAGQRKTWENQVAISIKPLTGPLIQLNWQQVRAVTATVQVHARTQNNQIQELSLYIP